MIWLIATLSACGDGSTDQGTSRSSASFTAANTGFQDDHSAGLISADPPPPAPPSVVDPMDPWAALGPLTGRYALSVRRIDDDCSFGPDVPLTIYKTSEIHAGSASSRTPSESFEIDLVHRGETIAFQLGEGVVFARWNAASERLEAVERIGAEGVIRYDDGFAVVSTSPGTDDVVITGASDWSFVGDYYSRQEQCSGRTHWHAQRSGGPPSATPEDLQIVLRWPASSRADLDLTIVPAGPDAVGLRDPEVDFAQSRTDCHSIRSTGMAAVDPMVLQGELPGFAAALDDTTLPYHEEIIRCRAADYGRWRFYVTNWSAAEVVSFDLEVFWGPRVNTTRPGERSFGVFPGGVGPLERVRADFELIPPPPGGGGANAGGITITFPLPDPDPDYPSATRPHGPLTGRHLEWNKAAFEGFPYEEFLLEIGL